MKFFIDTANLTEIKEANDIGVLDAVTTHPSLMAKVGVTEVHVITAPLASIMAVLHHPLTDNRFARFLEDAKKFDG